jgi:hypothetical protein
MTTGKAGQRPARTTLRSMAIALGAAVLSATVLAAPASAAQARHLDIEIHDGFHDDWLSDACGTDVEVTIDASLNVSLIYNRAGLLVREIDPSGGGTWTWTAPATGRSVSVPFTTGIIDYGDGAAIGSTYTSKLVGIWGHVPGFSSTNAGYIEIVGTVVGFEDNGSPLLDATGFRYVHGHFTDQDLVAATCAALTDDH